MRTVIKVSNLSKFYGRVAAVNNLTFDVHEGEVFGMVGPNGAGKTTTIECIEGMRKADKGTIEILGMEPQKDLYKLHKKIGIQFQSSSLPDRIKVWEAMDLFSSFYNDPADYKSLLKLMGIDEKRNSYFSSLSGGQKQRLFIALSLINNPEVIFLDELTTGLDPAARRKMWDLVKEIKDQGKTVFLTTQYMDEAEKLCDRLAIMNNGNIVALDTPEGIIQSYANYSGKTLQKINLEDVFIALTSKETEE